MGRAKAVRQWDGLAFRQSSATSAGCHRRSACVAVCYRETALQLFKFSNRFTGEFIEK